MIDYLPPVLDAASMREADRRTIESFGIPGFTLMDTAGRAVADEALLMLDEEDPGRVVCLCGKGNNGGDGFVAARVLQQSGIDVDVVLVAESSDLIGDAEAHFRLLENLCEAESGINLQLCERADELVPHPETALYIDSLLGTGLSSDVRNPLNGIIEWLNDQSVPVLAVDLPSGLHSDTGRVMGSAVLADVTVTMGALKSGLLIGEGPSYSGSIVVAEIGIPHHILDSVFDSEFSTRICQEEFVRSILPTRTRESHKYSTGPTIVFGGSPEFSGAPVLAATAAARVGSGYVVTVCPPEINAILAEKLTEIPVVSLKTDSSGYDIEKSLSGFKDRWEKARAILIGPGLGRDANMKAFVMELSRRAHAPVVLDADALFALIGERVFVRKHSKGNWVMTPHAGEFARLADSAPDSPIDAARTLAREWNAVVLLKGMPSITAAPDGRVVVNDTGNPAVATAGSGDVLSGMVAGLIAQGLEPFEAAVVAIHMGGAIADRYASLHASSSMMAGDVIAMIPDYLNDLG